jgi:hypothetical protein
VDYKELCIKMFALNRDIRFAGVLNKAGRLVAGGMREGIKPLEDEIHEKRWFNQIAIRREMGEMFDKLYGKANFVYVEREKIKYVTYFLPKCTVLVTLQPMVTNGKAIEVTESILDIIKTNNIQ